MPYADRTSWDRFAVHAPLVKEFDLVLSDWQDNLLPILQVLRLVGFSPIFPNLRRLNIIISNPPHTADVLHSLITPTLKSVHVEIREGLATLPDLAGILQMIEAIQQVQLTELSFSCSHPILSASSELVVGIAQAIEAQPRLRALDVFDAEGRFKMPFVHASQLPQLQRVRFQQSTPYEDPWDSIAYVERAIPTRGFPSLLEAGIESLAEDVPTVLAAITSPHLTALDLLVQGPNDEDEEAQPDADPLSNLDGAFDDLNRFTQLASVKIIFPASRLKWADLTPLLSCHLLKRIALEGYRLSLLIGDAEMGYMAQSWPELQELFIQDPTRIEQPLRGHDKEESAPQVSLRGLSVLGLHCPHLAKLTISVDARYPPSEIAAQAIGSKMHDLRLPYSWLNKKVESAETVAAAIVTMWPNQRMPKSGQELFWISERWEPTDRHPSWFSESYRQRVDGPWQRIWTEVYLNLSE